MHKFIGELGRFYSGFSPETPRARRRGRERHTEIYINARESSRYSEENFWNKYFHRFEPVSSFPPRSTVNSFSALAQGDVERRRSNPRNLKIRSEKRTRDTVGRWQLIVSREDSANRDRLYSSRNITKMNVESRNLQKIREKSIERYFTPRKCLLVSQINKRFVV